MVISAGSGQCMPKSVDFALAEQLERSLRLFFSRPFLAELGVAGKNHYVYQGHNPHRNHKFYK